MRGDIPPLVFVVPDYHPSTSGYASACTGFVEALAERPGVAIDVVALAQLGTAPERRLGNVTVHRLPRRRLFGKINVLHEELDVWRRVRGILRRRPDAMVVFETAEFPLAALLTLRDVGAGRVVCRVHGCAETEWILFRRRPLYLLRRWPTRALFRRLRLVTATSPFYVQFVQERFLGGNPLAIAAKQYDVIPNIVPAARNTDGPAVGSVGQYADGDRPVLLLSLGRMDRHGELQKNFARVLMAVGLLRDRPAGRRLRLVLVGQGSYRPTLERLVRELEIEDTVVFEDALRNDDVQALQRSAHGVLLASTFEGQSAFAVEALANGAGLLLADVGGLRGLVQHGANGLLFDPLDVWDIARKIEEYVTRIVPELDRARQASRDRFRAEFDPDAIVDRFLDDVRTWAALERATAPDRAPGGRVVSQEYPDRRTASCVAERRQRS